MQQRAMTEQRPTRATIHLDAIRHNVGVVRRRVGAACRIAAVVKADGYGHGAVEVSRAALEAGAEMLCVALPGEGAELRRHFPDVPVLVLGTCAREEAEAVVNFCLTQTVEDEAALDCLDRVAGLYDTRLRAHLKVDTGMSRIGVAPSEAAAFMRRATRCRHVEFEGVFSHFATADHQDLGFARQQLAVFREALDELARSGFEFQLRHMANSAGICTLPEAHFDMVRPGMMLYGLKPAPRVEAGLEPAMTLTSRIAKVKTVPAGTHVSYGRTYRCEQEHRIATVPAGYADGYSRALSNRFYAMVRGRRAPIVGRVCMDMFMADVSAIADARAGDEVLLLGKSGDDWVTAEAMAEARDTITQEIVVNVGPRVPRIYVDGPAGGGSHRDPVPA
jgi:alanine racemase